MLSRSAASVMQSARRQTRVLSHRALSTAADASAALSSVSSAASTSVYSPAAMAAPAVRTAAAPRPSQILGAHTLPPRLRRLSSDIEANSRPQRNPRTGHWNKPQLLAQERARLRKTDLMNGGVAALFEKVHFRRIDPVVLKGHKSEKKKIDRVARIKAAMVDMESRIEDHHRNERARRVRPGFYQLITGKKASGVLAAEEAAAREKKEKQKAAEKARQAASK